MAACPLRAESPVRRTTHRIARTISSGDASSDHPGAERFRQMKRRCHVCISYSQCFYQQSMIPSTRTCSSNCGSFSRNSSNLAPICRPATCLRPSTEFSTLPGCDPTAARLRPLPAAIPIVQAFNQLGQDLQSGNMTAAQQDYGTLKTGFPEDRPGAQQSSSPRAWFRWRQPAGEPAGDRRLQTGDIPAAQTVYNSLLQDFQQIGSGDALPLRPRRRHRVRAAFHLALNPALNDRRLTIGVQLGANQQRLTVAPGQQRITGVRKLDRRRQTSGL